MWSWWGHNHRCSSNRRRYRRLFRAYVQLLAKSLTRKKIKKPERKKRSREETRLNHSVKSSNWVSPYRTGSSFHHGFSLFPQPHVDLLLRRVLFREPPLSSSRVYLLSSSFKHFSVWIDLGKYHNLMIPGFSFLLHYTWWFLLLFGFVYIFFLIE